MLIIIDGENFRHQIARVLVRHGKIQSKKEFFAFDFVGFCSEILKDDNPQIIYVTTKIKHPNFQIPKQLGDLINIISISNRKWIAQLTNQNVAVVKAGYLRVKQSNACIHCGKRTLNLQEKGVDVRVATEIILASQKNIADIVLGSSDSDIIPALDAARKLGSKIKYVCYAAELNRSVAASVDKVVTFDDVDVIRHCRN